jgi:hypothetical protein
MSTSHRQRRNGLSHSPLSTRQDLGGARQGRVKMEGDVGRRTAPGVAPAV